MVISPATNRRAFTLVELVVLVAMAVVLAGVLPPALVRADEKADRAQCQNNLKQIAVACRACHAMQGRFPPTVGSLPKIDNSEGTLQFYLLPYLGEGDLYKQAQVAAGNLSPWNMSVYSNSIPLFRCPSDTTAGISYLYDGWLGTTSYASNFLVFGLNGATYADIPDGVSNTVFFAERYQICNQTPCAWAYSGQSEWAPMFAYSTVARFQQQPPQAQCNPALAQAIHSGGIQVGMGDASVRTVRSSVDPKSWWLGICPNDGLPVPNDFFAQE
jgi:Tfp pilus assembly protein PilE